MGDGTAIEWTDATWNPLRGCSRMSAGCANCYAERVAARFSGQGQPYEGLARMTAKGPAWTGKVALVDHMLDQPRRWQRPRRIFVNSMSDLFHDDVPDEWISRIVSEMAAAPRHRFQVLTKRPGRMADYLQALGGEAMWLLPHVWWGTSVEAADVAEERCQALMMVPSVNLWVSAEPLIGALDLRRWLDVPLARHIAWVVAGGESGPGARPMALEWARSLRRQCAEARVPFLFKQWGEWGPGSQDGRHSALAVSADATLYRIGKRNAGRELDGRTWDEYPAGMLV